MIHTTHYASPLGDLLLAEQDGALIGLWMEHQKYFPKHFRENECTDCPVLLQTKQWLSRYFAGEKPSVRELPLAPAGSDFRQSVWDILCEIPYGQVTTYGAIAKQIAARRGLSSMSAQAVGGAVGHNPISIIIPCHRVVGANGSLTGYAGGIGRKLQLLTLEGAEVQSQFLSAADMRQ